MANGLFKIWAERIKKSQLIIQSDEILLEPAWRPTCQRHEGRQTRIHKMENISVIFSRKEIYL